MSENDFEYDVLLDLLRNAVFLGAKVCSPPVEIEEMLTIVHEFWDDMQLERNPDVQKEIEESLFEE